MKSLSFFLFFSSFLPLSMALFGIGTLQSVAVKGILTCNGRPAENVKLKLYEVEAIVDDLLDERFSSANGAFLLSGKATEITSIDPKLNIYHKCNYDGMCFKKVEIEIPDAFITEGELPEKTFDVGEINLAGKFNGETTDCLN